MICLRCAYVFLLALAIGPADSSAEFPRIPYYVGRGVCLECHGPADAGKPCSLENIGEHDNAWSALHKPEAKDIAGLSGVWEPPEKSRICLGCHATGADAGPRWTNPTFDMRDGVQCEACHDAGSLHVEEYRTAVSPDEPSGPPRILRGSRQSCTACHIPRSSHDEVLVNGYRRPAADSRYKTPVNLAVSPDGNRLYVVCENSNSLIVLDSRDGSARAEIAVGLRPHGVAVSPDGSRLYVTCRFSNTLTVIDARTHAVAAEILVGHEPHGVVIDHAGQYAYVANTGENTVSVVNLDQLTETKRLAAGVGPWSLALAPDGRKVWVTNIRPSPGHFREPPKSEVTIVSATESRVVYRAVLDDANMLQGIQLVPGHDVAICTLVRTKNLVPLTRLSQGWCVTNGLGILWPDGRTDQLLLDEPASAFADPMDIAVSPDGRYALVTSGGTNQIALVDLPALLSVLTLASDDDRRNVLPNHLGLSRGYVLKRLPVGRNPRGVIYSPDGRRAYVASALDDAITVIDMEQLCVERTIGLGGPKEMTQTRLGERLFHAATFTLADQFSCRTCHPEGHTNGLTFDIEPDGAGLAPLDNRSLRGVFDTAPFKWEGTNPTLHRHCGKRLAMFFTRMAPLAPADLDALVRYISNIERPSNRHRRPDGLTPSQRRGKALFERTVSNDGEPINPEHRCVTCHASPYGHSEVKSIVGSAMWFDATVDVEIGDLSDVEEFGNLGVAYFYDGGAIMKRYDAAHLLNLYDSAPYLHNGASATLEEMWTRYNLYEAHGMAGDWTRRQLNDLIAYLKAR